MTQETPGLVWTNVEKGIDCQSFGHWRDFIGWLTDAPKRNDYFWRGVKDADYKLVPSIYRKEGNFLKNYGLCEAKTLDYFRALAMSRLPGCSSLPEPGNASDLSDPATLRWWCLAQHMEIPTPLLDWSCHAMVALYFAVEDIHKSKKFPHTVAVYAIRKPLAGALGKIEEHINGVSRYLRFECRQEYIEKRISAQGGIFSYIKNYDDKGPGPYKDTYYDIKNVIKLTHNSNRNILLQSNININNEQEALNCRFFLAQAGITKAHLYPDLVGIKKEIEFRIENDFFAGSFVCCPPEEAIYKLDYSVNRDLPDALGQHVIGNVLAEISDNLDKALHKKP